MANWIKLKEVIANVIKTNGNQEITGQVLQNTLNNIVNAVGKNATFVGVATPSTNPGTPDGPVFYIATTAGNYSNFGNIEVLKGETAILKWNNGTWTKNAIKPMTDFNSVFDANGKSLTEVTSDIKSSALATDMLLSKYCCDKQNLELASIEDGKYWTSYSEKSTYGSYRCCSVDVTSYRGKKIMIKVGYIGNPCGHSYVESGALSSRIIEKVKDVAIILVSDADTELHLSWDTNKVGRLPVVAVIDDSKSILHSLQTSVKIYSEGMLRNIKAISKKIEITWDESRNGMYLNDNGTLHEPVSTTSNYKVSSDIPVSIDDIFEFKLMAYGSYDFMLYDASDSVIAFHKCDINGVIYEGEVLISMYADKNPSYIRFCSRKTWYVNRREVDENYIHETAEIANEAAEIANEVYNNINDHTETIVDLVNTYDGIYKYWSAPDTLSSHDSYAYISIIPETLIPEYIGKYIYLRVGYTTNITAYSYVKYEDSTFVALKSLVSNVYFHGIKYAKLLVTEDIARIDLSWDRKVLVGTQTVCDLIQGAIPILDNRVTILENSITTPLIGKKIFLFGDSISSTDYNWYKDYLAKYTGATVYNQGASGCNVQYQASNLYFDRLASIKPDIIVALLGGNDSGSSGSVGTFDENSELGKLGETLQAESDITADYVVSGTAGTSGVVYQSDKFIVGLSHIFRKWRAEYYNYRLSANLNATLFKAQSDTEPQEIYSGTEAECIKYAKDNNYALAPVGQYYVKCTEIEADKHAKLISVSMPKFYICTTLPQKRHNDSSPYSKPENWERKRLACIEVAKKYNIPCIDLAKEFAIDWGAEPYWPGNGYSGTSKTDNQGIYTMDGLHPNEFGYAWISQIVARHIK